MSEEISDHRKPHLRGVRERFCLQMFSYTDIPIRVTEKYVGTLYVPTYFYF